MAKIALLIGVSEYEPGLDGLPSAVNDAIAMEQVLTNPDMGEFADADVMVLSNPDRQTMADAIYRLFANRQKDDLVLLYFSGHGVVDDSGEFYFTNRLTRKEQGKLVPSTALEARSVREWLEQSRSQCKVIILDSCFSGAFARGVKAKDSGSVNPAQFLGGKGTAILTASTSTQYALTQDGFDLSVYTHYLVEGIRTGGADQDDDGFIAMEELHTYASSKVKEAAPAMTPEFYPVKEGYKILLAKSPKDDPKLRYRKQVKLLAEEDESDFSFINRHYLDDLQRNLALLPDDAATIELEELEPYRQRRAKVDRYRTVFEGAIAQRYPLRDRDRTALQRLQQLLSLRDEDIAAIEQDVSTQFSQHLEASHQREIYETNLRQYAQQSSIKIQAEYPLSQLARDNLGNIQESLGLREEDITRIEQPIFEQAEAKYQEKLKQDELDLERKQQAELQSQIEQEKYKNKLQQYKQEFARAIQVDYPLSNHVREGLLNFQRSLQLNDTDIAFLEKPITDQAEAKYQEKLKQQEVQRQEAERLRQSELKKQREQDEYQQKLVQYQECFHKEISQVYPNNIESKRESLKELQNFLKLKHKDIIRVEETILEQVKVRYQEGLRNQENLRFQREEINRQQETSGASDSSRYFKKYHFAEKKEKKEAYLNLLFLPVKGVGILLLLSVFLVILGLAIYLIGFLLSQKMFWPSVGILVGFLVIFWVVPFREG